jgi:hypothetical protein
MSGYQRTAIRRLSIAGFRSIRSLELRDIPDLVVLHGPNGAGKSNLLLAAQLVLRAAAMPGDLPVSRERAVDWPLVEADKLLGLRPDDFHFGALPEIRIGLDVDLGTKAAAIVGIPRDQQLGMLSLELVVQKESESGLRYWFERADVDGEISLGPDTDPDRQEVRQSLAHQRNIEAMTRAQLTSQEASLLELSRQSLSRTVAAQRAQLRASMGEIRQRLQTAA